MNPNILENLQKVNQPQDMKYLYLLPLGLALLTASCQNKTASTNPYENNPYYGPSGSSYGDSTTDYSSTPSSASYPSYSESAYTPPTSNSGNTSSSSAQVPSVPETPGYADSPSYASNSSNSTSSSPSTYTRPYGNDSSASSHTVSSGDNLYRISLKYGTSVAAIKNANGLSGDTIHPGQVLRIP